MRTAEKLALRPLRVVAVLLFLAFSPVLAAAASAPVLSEAQYARDWCQKEGGQIVRPPGAPTPVCELAKHRVAVAFAENWAATIGGAYFITIDSEKKPGAALILRAPDDQRYWNLLNRTLLKQHLPIRTWAIQP